MGFEYEDDESFADQAGLGIVDSAVEFPHLRFGNPEAVIFTWTRWRPIQLPRQTHLQWGGQHHRERWPTGVSGDGQQRGAAAREMVGAVDDRRQTSRAAVDETALEEHAGLRIGRRIGRIPGDLRPVSGIRQHRCTVSQSLNQRRGQRRLARPRRAEQYHHAGRMRGNTVNARFE